MIEQSLFRRLLLGLLTGCALTVAAISLPIAAGALTPAAAQVSGEFQDALAPYGTWRRHPQFGDVWVPSRLPRGWQPYQYGHWVYTDDWGWYWVSDETEADWGWVAYHYGRWAFERDLGWFWVPGAEWAPAWVDWRYGDDYVGWAPLPPDDLIDAYDEEPSYWVFVAPRYLTASRPRSYFVPGNRRAAAFRSTRVVNRTVAVQGRRLAVNPGIAAGVIASVTRSSVPAYRVRPRVLAGTQGVTGAVVTRGGPAGPGGRGRSNALSVQRTSTVINASPSVAAPAALGKGERGRLGTHPPRAAQGAAPAATPAVAPANAPAAAPKAPAAAPAVAPPAPPNVPPPRQEPRRNEPPPAAGGPPPLRPPPPQSGPANPQRAPAARPAPQNVPAVARPPEPPRPAPPVAHPAAPPVAHPAPPPVAHPAPPPVAHPVPPAAAKPAPPPKPGEKPPEPSK